MDMNISNENNRTQNAFNNSLAGIVFYFVSMLANFAYRTIFIYYLSVEYLGIQGILTNILSLLSLAEMGIGSALTFSMYKPIAQNDKSKISALLQLYKVVYRIIAISILILGLMLMQYLDFFVESRPNIPESLELIFMLYVLNTAVSYVLIYKQSILHADQKGFIVTLWTNVFMIIRYIVQFLWICNFKTFVPTLIVQLVLSLCSNILLSKIVDNKYPYLKSIKSDQKLNKDEKNGLIKKIRAMLLYRIAAYVVNSTDNILISKYIGIISVGIFSNYIMLLGLAKSVMNFISTALTPSIGNQVEKQTPEEIMKVFKTLYFMLFWMSSITTIFFATMLNPFIELWIGKEYLLSNAIVTFLVVNYYILMMRRLMVSYRNALGLYEIARFKPVLEAIINLVASLFLLKHFGILGVVIGTTISSVSTSLWIEPYIMYKHYFKTGLKYYWKRYIEYTLFTIVVSGIMIILRELMYDSSISTFIMLAILTVLIPNFLVFILFRKIKEYKEFLSRIKWIRSKFATKIRSNKGK